MMNITTRNISCLAFLFLLLTGRVVSKDLSHGPIDTELENEIFNEEIQMAEMKQEVAAGEDLAASVDGESYDLDTDRDAMIFNVNQRKGGLTYLDTYDLKMDQSIPMAGLSIETKTVMRMESETAVQDLAEGGQSIDMRFTHVMMDMEAGPMNVHCDSDKVPNDGEEEDIVSNLACQPLFDMISDSSIHFLMDDEGTIVDADGPGTEVNQAISQEAKSQPNPGSENLQQAARLLQLILHDVPIKPGQDWDASEDMGALGKLTARGTLQGYTKFESVDCAVVTVSGSLEMDVAKAIQMMGGGSPGAMAPAAEGVSVSDATMDVTLYFDYENSFVRWSQNNVSMIISMPDQLSGDILNVPSTQTITTTTHIKED